MYCKKKKKLMSERRNSTFAGVMETISQISVLIRIWKVCKGHREVLSQPKSCFSVSQYVNWFKRHAMHYYAFPLWPSRICHFELIFVVEIPRDAQLPSFTMRDALPAFESLVASWSNKSYKYLACSHEKNKAINTSQKEPGCWTLVDSYARDQRYLHN